MDEKTKALYDEAGRLHHQAKALMDAYDGKEMPQEITNQIDALLDASEEKSTQAKRHERAAAQERDLSQPANRLGAGATEGEKSGEVDADAVRVKGFNRFLSRGVKALNGAELKALRADDDEAGGFLTAPRQVASEILKFVDDATVIRQLATVEQTAQAESLGVITMTSDFEDLDWTTELATGSEDATKPFGDRELRAHPLAKRLKISRTLLRKATRDPEMIVKERLGYRLGVTQEKAYMTGNGAQKPLGLFTASNDGIPTSRDVTMSATTAFTADDLIDAKFALKEQYQRSPSTRWILSREFVKRARKLKSGDGQYIWGPGLGAGQPATLVDVPYVMSEFAPATFTTGQYIAVIGDLKKYWILDALSMQIQVLNELYAETNQVGYIVRYEGDGAPMLDEAFRRLKLA